MNNIKENKICTGCNICQIICPKKAIEMKISNQGFYIPFVNREKCIDCGKCLIHCPVHFKIEKKEIKGAYAVWSNNDKTRKTCTSGGIAYEIAKLYLKKGYNACGAIYDKENQITKHVIIDNLNDYEKCKGSKYMQSYIGEALQKIINNSEQNYVIFGTPCQIAAIKGVVENQKRKGKIILVDFFCHGVPTIFLWKNYLKYLKNEKNMEEIEKVQFRSKAKGWHEYTISTIDRKGNEFIQSLTENNWYMQFFLSDMCLNEACYQCKFKAENSMADIRVGDLWGEKYKYNNEGISGVLTFSPKGEEIMQEMANFCTIIPEKVEIVISEQIKTNTFKPILRKNIIKSLKKQKNFKEIYYSKVIISKIHRKLRRKKNEH